MSNRAFLAEFEQMVLLSILQLRDRAYGPEIAELLEARVGRRVSRGALYATLERLAAKKLTRWSIEAATSEREGSRKRRFGVTDEGLRRLRASRDALAELWRGVEPRLAKSGR